MAIGETLLKISDYPFAYAVAFLFIRINGINLLSADATPYLIAAGIAATMLAVVDPVGRFVKGWLMLIEKNYLNRRKNYDKILKSWSEVKVAFHTQPIEKEKDKIVNTIYFLVFLALLMSAIQNDSFYLTHFSALYKNNPNCNLSCSQKITFYSIFAASLIIGGFGAWNGSQIFSKIRTVAIYLFCKNSIAVSSSSVQAMSDFIKLGDWETAKSWKEKISSEYLQEDALKPQREERFSKHVLTLLTEFKNYKKEIDANNRNLLLDYSTLGNPTKLLLSLDEIFKKFPLYESLITHLYTNTDKEIFNLVRNYILLVKELDQENKEWEKTKNEEVDKIVNSISFPQPERTIGGIRSLNTREWINIYALKTHLENFISTDRKSLIPIEREQPQSDLYKVRFFDRTGYPHLGDDRIAVLKEQQATKLTNNLASLAEKLRDSVKEFVKKLEEKRILEQQIEEKLDFLFTAVSVGGEPLSGSCRFCRNEKFFDKSTILSHLEELRNFPYVELELRGPVT